MRAKLQSRLNNYCDAWRMQSENATRNYWFSHLTLTVPGEAGMGCWQGWRW